MKKQIFTLVVLFVIFSSQSFAQYMIAGDDGSNYTTWSDGDNQGFGFEAWDLWTGGDGNTGNFISSSVGDGFGDIDTDSKSFGLYGNPDNDDYSHAKRLISNWSDGAVFSVNLAIAYRNGNKGIDLIATGDEVIFNFNANDDAYRGQGTDLGWDYSQTSIFTITTTQNGSDIDVSVTRGSDSYSTTITGKTLEAVKFYCGDTDEGNALNNLYFNNLKVAYADPTDVPETADITIDGDVTLGATDTLTVNNLSVPSGNSFTLASTSSGTASLIINGDCTDEIKVERFLTGGWDWHFLSSPVIDQPIVGDENFIAFNLGVGGNLGDSLVDFYMHDETVADNPWINIKNIDTTLSTSFGIPSDDPLFISGQGYLVAYDGSNLIKTFTGVPYTNAYFTILSYTTDGSKGWNLLGNPYQSAFEWNHANNFFSGIDSSYYYIYNENANGGGGGYEYYYDVFRPSTDNANGFIPAMQGFFVRTKAVGSSITISPFSRTHNDQGYLKNQLQNEHLLTFKIQGEMYFSKNQIYLLDGSSAGADGNDAYMLISLNNEVPHFYSFANNEKLAANCVPYPNEDYSIPMGLKTGEAGTYTISALDILDFDSNIRVLLEDTETGAEINLRVEGSYTFQVSEPGINNSRFILHLKSSVGINEAEASQKPAVSITSNQMQVYNLKSGEYEVRVMDIMGRILLNESFSAGSAITLPTAIKAGAYIVQISGERGQWVDKVIIK